MASARQLPEDGEVSTCRIRTPGGFGASGPQADAVRRGQVAPDPASGGVVCGYREGWLVDARPLDAAAATRLAKQLNTAPSLPSPALRDCFSADPPDDSNGVWTVTFRSQDGTQVRVRVNPLVCQEASIVTDRGVEAGATKAIVATLADYARGPVYSWGDKPGERSQLP